MPQENVLESFSLRCHICTQIVSSWCYKFSEQKCPNVVLCSEIKSLKFGFKDQLRGRHWDAQRGEIGKGRDMNKKSQRPVVEKQLLCEIWRRNSPSYCLGVWDQFFQKLICLGSEHKVSKRVEKRDHSPLDWIFWPPTGKEGLCFKCVKLFLHQIIFRPLVFCHEIVGDSGIFCPGGRRWL